jgi:hypothetical protein
MNTAVSDNRPLTVAAAGVRPEPDRGPPKLTAAHLREAQRQTLGEPRRRYGVLAKALFALMDIVYGKGRTLPKFKVLEVIARVPYQAWENVGYVAITHTSSRPPFARRVFQRVEASRDQQDNEQWHLLILQELIWVQGQREGFVRYKLLPQVIAYAYHRISWLLYVIRPAWSYSLNADFEDHAEHEYALFVQENPALEYQRYDGLFSAEYGSFDSLADLFRQIGHDERMHKEESIASITEARYR